MDISTISLIRLAVLGVILMNVSAQLEPLQVRIEGAPFILKTGISNWTVIMRGMASYKPTLSCISYLDEDVDVSLGQGGHREDEVDLEDITTGTHDYTCHLNATKESDTNTYMFTMMSNIVVNIVAGDSLLVPHCVTSVRDTGLIGEYAELYCLGNDAEWQDTRERTKYVSLSEEVLTSSCEVRRQGGSRPTRPPCNVDYLSPLQGYLELTITPTSYSLANSSLNFTCESTPPRLIFWEVLGTDGDLLHNDFELGLVQTNTNITITQKPGYSQLRIVEGEPGGNGIHTVRCYTYDTVRNVSEARVMTSDRLRPRDNADQSEEGGSPGSIITIIILILIIIVMGGVICFMYYKMKRGGAGDHPETTDRDPPVAQLHTNLAYEASGNTIGNVVRTPSTTAEDDVPNSVIPPGTELQDSPAYEASESVDHEYTYISA